MRESAGAVADEFIAEIEYSPCDSGAVHELTGQNKKRYRKQGEAVNSSHEALCHDRQADVVRQKIIDGGNEHAIDNGHIQKDQHEKNNKKGDHAVSSFLRHIVFIFFISFTNS